MEKLAIHGGVPVRTKRWVSKYMGGEELGAEEKKRVLQVLDKKTRLSLFSGRSGEFRNGFIGAGV